MKPIIYQLFPRLFTNKCNHCIPNGSIEENGVGKMNDINDTVLSSIKNLGVTHIWYTGIIEHATKTDYSKYGITPDNSHIVKGNAGSPYAIKDYYDVDPDIAVNVPERMKEFEELVTRTHKNKLKVIIDFIPNHVSRQYHSEVKPAGIEDLGEGDDTSRSFAPNNNFYYITHQLFSPGVDLGSGKDSYYEFPAKATGNDCFSAFPNQNDWYETVKLNYGIDFSDMSKHFSPIPGTWYKMVNILRFWSSKGVDGFRCDMAHMVPVDFWNWAIPLVKEKYPDTIFIAEIYDKGLYRNYIFNGHFDYLYDKVGLYDTIRGIICNNFSAASITDCWQSIDGINSHMLNFLENHDEQRFASKQFAGSSAPIIPAFVVSSTINSGPMLIYQGQELGENAHEAEGFSGLDGRTTIFDYWCIPTLRRWYNNGKCNSDNLTQEEVRLRGLYENILNICNKEKAISEGSFFDLMYVNYNNLDPHRHYIFLRYYKNEVLYIIANFNNQDATLQIDIPPLAFELMGIKQGTYSAQELISSENRELPLKVGVPLITKVDALGATIWKFKTKSIKNK